MSGFENYAKEVKEIELEIERKGVVLGIDWDDATQLRELAREAVTHSAAAAKDFTSGPDDYQAIARLEFFGLAQLMLQAMKESAIDDIESHGGKTWKAFARALYAEMETPPRLVKAGAVQVTD